MARSSFSANSSTSARVFLHRKVLGADGLVNDGDVGEEVGEHNVAVGTDHLDFGAVLRVVVLEVIPESAALERLGSAFLRRNSLLYATDM